MAYKSKNIQCGFFVPYLHGYLEIKRNYSLEDEREDAKGIHDAREEMNDIALKVPGFAKIALNVLKDLEKSKSYLNTEDNTNYKSTIKSVKRLENPLFFKKRNRHHFKLHTKEMIDNIAFTVLVSNGFGSSIIEKMKESEELGDLSEKLEDSLNKKTKYVNKLVEAYEPIIDELAEKYSKVYGISKEILYQEGNLATMRAAGKWDYQRGKRFIAFAPLEIMAYMSIANEKNRLIKLPRGFHKYLSELRKYSLDLFKNEKKETSEQKAKNIGMPEYYWKDVGTHEKKPMYLEDLVSNEDLYWEELISDEKLYSQLDMTIFKDLWFKTYEKLKTLPKKSKDVLRFRFGITDKESSPLTVVDDHLVQYDDKRTLEKIGEFYGVSKEAIRQRQDKSN